MNDERDGELTPESRVLQVIADDEGIIDNGDGTRTVVLESPLKLAKKVRRGEHDDVEEVTELTFRKSTAKDWLETDKETGEMAKQFRFAARLCGISYGNFLTLSGDDASRCIAVANTMGKELPTGGR